jgi:uncharacterized glyoxalase superfamily protein PhnB
MSNSTTLTYSPLLGVVLAVEDLERASLFYQKLGFQQEMALQGDDGQLVHVTLRFGPNILLLGRLSVTHYTNEVRARAIGAGPRGLGVTLLIVVPDLQAVYDAVKGACLEILLEPVDEFYGDRVFMFLDPFGYEWKIAQTIQQMSPEEVIQASGLQGNA